MPDSIDETLAALKNGKNKADLYAFLLKRAAAIAEKPVGRDERLLAVSSLLRDFVPAFDWVGFYLVNPEKQGELLLGPFAGKPTEHVNIPFGKGICGQVAETLQPLVVSDVTQQGNYLSCSPDVKSEIVIPLLMEGEFRGELDIDSETLNAFDDEDRAFLEKVCELISPIL